jgi:hypothetical protein
MNNTSNRFNLVLGVVDQYFNYRVHYKEILIEEFRGYYNDTRNNCYLWRNSSNYVQYFDYGDCVGSLYVSNSIAEYIIYIFGYDNYKLIIEDVVYELYGWNNFEMFIR